MRSEPRVDGRPLRCPGTGAAFPLPRSSCATSRTDRPSPRATDSTSRWPPPASGCRRHRCPSCSTTSGWTGPPPRKEPRAVRCRAAARPGRSATRGPGGAAAHPGHRREPPVRGPGRRGNPGHRWWTRASCNSPNWLSPGSSASSSATPPPTSWNGLPPGHGRPRPGQFLVPQQVSHELRSLLTPPRPPLQELITDRAEPLTQHAPTAGPCARAAHRLERMVDTWLQAPDDGALQPDRQPTDISRGDRRHRQRLRRDRRGRRPCAETVQVPAEPVVVVVDRAMWTTVVTNLLGNAVKYTDRGGVTVTINRDGGEVAAHRCRHRGSASPRRTSAPSSTGSTSGHQSPGYSTLPWSADLPQAHGGQATVHPRFGARKRLHRHPSGTGSPLGRDRRPTTPHGLTTGPPDRITETQPTTTAVHIHERRPAEFPPGLAAGRGRRRSRKLCRPASSAGRLERPASPSTPKRRSRCGPLFVPRSSSRT